MLLQSNFSLSLPIILASIVAAVIPTLFFVTIIYLADRYEKEPVWLLAAAFFWGAIPSIVAAFIINTLLSIPPYLVLGPVAGDIIGATFVAPVIEESLKGLAIVGILLIWRQEFDSHLDGIIYGAMVGLGFAMVENVFYYITVYAESGPSAWSTNIFFRGVVFGLNHALFTSLTGLGVAVARLSGSGARRILAPLIGWSAATFLHFLHNLTASVGGFALLFTIASAWGGLAILSLIIIWAILQERHWLRQYLAEEVIKGTLSDQQYHLACSSRRRFQHRLRLLMAGRLGEYFRVSRYFLRVSELAYRKHHYTLFKDKKSADLVTRLRPEVRALGEAGFG